MAGDANTRRCSSRSRAVSTSSLFTAGSVVKLAAYVTAQFGARTL